MKRENYVILFNGVCRYSGRITEFAAAKSELRKQYLNERLSYLPSGSLESGIISGPFPLASWLSSSSFFSISHLKSNLIEMKIKNKMAKSDDANGEGLPKELFGFIRRYELHLKISLNM